MTKHIGILTPLDYPTVVNNIHESVYRSWQMLELIERLLETETDRKIILSLIRELRGYKGRREELVTREDWMLFPNGAIINDEMSND